MKNTLKKYQHEEIGVRVQKQVEEQRQYPTIQEKQMALIEMFDFMSDWQDKYSEIIAMGKHLVPYPDAKLKPKYLVKGCQSQVWFDAQVDEEGRLYFEATSDAIIVKGLIALLLSVYNHQTPEAILTSNKDFIKTMGLDQHLSPTRNQGLYAMLSYIYHFAQENID